MEREKAKDKREKEKKGKTKLNLISKIKARKRVWCGVVWWDAYGEERRGGDGSCSYHGFKLGALTMMNNKQGEGEIDQVERKGKIRFD